MKVLVFEGPGVMALHDRPEPVAGPDDVVVAVRSAGICGSDVHGYLGLTGRRVPGVVMGHEAAGVVTAIGDGVSSARVGDRVALRSILSCGACERCRDGQPNICLNRRGLGMQFQGAYAERVAVPEAMALRLPDEIGDDEAALIEPLAVAVHAVNLTPFEPGATVAIIGAGAIGLLALLVAKRRGAGWTVITDRSPHRLQIARDLGVDLAINVDERDPVAAIREATGGLGADVVFEAVGISATVAHSILVARAGGRVTWIGNSHPMVEVPMQEVVTREIRLQGTYTFDDREFEQAADAIASGAIDVKPLIERVAPLDDAVELFRALGDGSLDVVKVILKPGGAPT
jgi:L-iditol 2-dehydrogenase